MRKFILNIIIFFTLVIIVDVCFGVVTKQMIANSKGGVTKQMNDICLKDNYDLLIMGSSRAHHHYVPGIIEDSLAIPTYNAGYDGNGIILHYGIYKMITERYTPKVVIYDVVAGFDLVKDDKTRYVGNLRYYSDDENIADLIASVDGTEKYKNWSRTYKYNSRFVDIVAQCMSNAQGTATEYDYAPLYGEMKYDVANQ